MKRFEFKLQAVLTLRQRAEQVALEKYGRAIQHRQAAAHQVSEAEMELSESRRQWLHALADGCPAVHASQMLEFSHSLQVRKRYCEQSLLLADVELNQASQKMLQARQAREAVEIYLTRQRELHDCGLLDEERKFNDEWRRRNTECGMRNAANRKPHSENRIPKTAFRIPNSP